MSRYIVGVDLGQANDYTATAILDRQGADLLAIRYLERRRDVGYPTIVRDLAATLLTLRDWQLVVDYTGVGRPVLDLLDEAGLRPIGVTITGRDTPSRDGRHWRVPKRDLASTVAVLLQSRRLRIAGALPLAPVLTQELQNFRVKLDARTGHDSYAADWREGGHDDLVLAVALAAWSAEHPPPSRRLVTFRGAGRLPAPPPRAGGASGTSASGTTSSPAATATGSRPARRYTGWHHAFPGTLPAPRRAWPWSSASSA